MSLARLVTRLESLSLGPFLFCTRDGYAVQNPRSVNHAALQSLQLPDPITSITKVCWTPLEAQLTLRAEARYRLPLGTFLGEDLEAVRPRTEYLPFGPPLDVICMLSTYSAGGARVPSAFVLTRSVAADAFAVSVTSPPRDKVAHRNHFLAQEMEVISLRGSSCGDPCSFRPCSLFAPFSSAGWRRRPTFAQHSCPWWRPCAF